MDITTVCSPLKNSDTTPIISPFDQLPPPLGVGEFEAFNSIAHIYSIAIDPPHGPPFAYNDDVRCQHYEGSLNSYMSFQRNRLNIDNLSACSRQDFVTKATQQPSPFAEVSPIPDDIRRSINFLSSNTPALIRAFWQRQFDHLRSLVTGRQERSAAWYANAPIELSRFHRRYPLGAWAAIMHFLRFGRIQLVRTICAWLPYYGKPVAEIYLPHLFQKTYTTAFLWKCYVVSAFPLCCTGRPPTSFGA